MLSTSMRLVRKPHAAVVADEEEADEVAVAVAVDASQAALVVEIGIEAVIDG